MKILHINTHARGGAFNGAYRLHNALLKHNIKSKMLVTDFDQTLALNEVYAYNKPCRKQNITNRILTRLGYPITAQQKRYFTTKNLKGQYEIISYPYSDYDITKTKEFEEADIINLQWTANFLDYKSFFKKCKKPIVITLRDLFPIQGIFHYEEDVLKNKQKFGKLEEKMRSYKRTAIEKSSASITIVGISNWITQKSAESNIHKGFKHLTIHNCINIEEYELLNKQQLRLDFNIPLNHLVLAFISDGVINDRKGTDLFINAICKLKDLKNLTVLTAGRGIPPKFPYNIVHRHLGSLKKDKLNKVFSVSDALIFPSKEEALGNVMLESMACGTPVLGTPIGGLLDVIKPGLNGLFSLDVSSEALKNAIEHFIETKGNYNSKKIRAYIEEHFSEELITSKYIKLYNDLLLQ